MDELESVRQLVAELLQQAERCARAGLLQQAEALMVQVWSMAEGCAPDLANSAAWEAALLLVQMQNYDGAAEWLGRVAAPPTGGSGLWPAGRQALMQLCLSHASTPSAPGLTHTHSSAFAAVVEKRVSTWMSRPRG